MPDFINVGPKGTIHLLGIKLVGFNAENAGKLAISLLLFAMAYVLSRFLKLLLGQLFKRSSNVKILFWSRQGVNLGIALGVLLVLSSIWFDDPSRLATAVGLISAGLAFALQKVVTALAGYFVILRGNIFSIGDRIVMGGVRGDVVGLSFTQTVIMEMGQPPGIQSAEPAMWVKSRQYSGRIVTVSNSKVFDEPVYNYTRDFDFIWEELAVPVSYSADRKLAEAILLEAANQIQLAPADVTAEDITELKRRYFVSQIDDFVPRVYWRLTDNWLELSVRFLARASGVRAVKDSMSRFILARFDENGITIASATFEIVGMPALNVKACKAESEC